MYKTFIKEHMTSLIIVAYMQYIFIKKTMTTILFDYRREVEEDTKEPSFLLYDKVKKKC